MNKNGQRQSASLAEILQTQGKSACINRFQQVSKQNKNMAISLLNSKDMTFPCLFALIPHIEKTGLQQKMLTKYAVSMEISKQILSKDYSPKHDYLKDNSQKSRDALLWIVETGLDEQFPPEEFQLIIDISVSVLINLHKETSILPNVAKYIFARRKRGQNVHELIWAFFRSRNISSLKLFAEQLLNADNSEAEFICDILGIEYNSKINPKREHKKYVDWLSENEKTLLFNEENKQFTAKPVVCKMNQTIKKEEKS